MDASKRAASCPEFGLAALTPRFLCALILSSAAAAAWVLRSSVTFGGGYEGCRGRVIGRGLLPVDARGWSIETKVCPPVWLDDLEQIDPICVSELFRFLLKDPTGIEQMDGCLGRRV